MYAIIVSWSGWGALGGIVGVLGLIASGFSIYFSIRAKIEAEGANSSAAEAARAAKSIQRKSTLIEGATNLSALLNAVDSDILKKDWDSVARHLFLALQVSSRIEAEITLALKRETMIEVSKASKEFQDLREEALKRSNGKISSAPINMQNKIGTIAVVFSRLSSELNQLEVEGNVG